MRVLSDTPEQKMLKEYLWLLPEEASFLWILRDDAVRAPNYSVKDLADLDERVEANLDGLRVAGQFGWKTCEEALDVKEPGEVFTAGVLAFESGDNNCIQKVLEIGCTSAELERALISALGWISFDQIEASVNNFPNTVNAVNCAIRIQQVMAKYSLMP